MTTIFDGIFIRFADGSEIMLPAWLVAVIAVGLLSAVGALAIWGLVRWLNWRSSRH